MATPVPPPPEGRFGKWAYQLWDYVAKNRPGFSNARISGTAPIAVSSSGTSSFGVSHNTSGVSAGTYGTNSTWPLLVIDARGHVTSASAGGTAGAAGLVAVGDVLGTTTTGTLTAALSTTGVAAGTYGGTAGIPRFDIDVKGRVLSGTTVVLTANTPILLSAGSGTLAWSHADAGTGIVPGATYGADGFSQEFILDTKGHVTFAGAVGLSPYFVTIAGTNAGGTWTGSYSAAAGPVVWPNGAYFSFQAPAENTGALAFTVIGTRGTAVAGPLRWDPFFDGIGGEFLTGRMYTILFNGTSYLKIAAGSPTEALDFRFRIRDNSDQTKQAMFRADSIPSGSSATFDFQSQSGTLGYAPYSGTSTPLVTTGATVFAIGGLPAWVTAVDVLLAQTSLSGTGFQTLRLGVSTGAIAGGYNGITNLLATTGILSAAMNTTGFELAPGGTGAAATLRGIVSLRKHNPTGNIWQAVSQVSRSNATLMCLAEGTVGLTEELTSVGLYVAAGTSTFDGGSIQWRYW